MKYFVMLRHPNGKPLPLTGEDDDFPMMFETEEAAEKAGFDNGLGNAYGFEVFEW